MRSGNQLLITELRHLFIQHFSLEELRTLAYDSGINPDELREGGLSAQAQSLLELADRQGKLDKLIDECQTVRPHITWPRRTADAIPCPYRGLFAFQEKDADLFFGREAFADELVTRVEQQDIVAVVGPSGSGKSSVVMAGLIPRLRMQKGWRVIQMRPGPDPFQALASALVPFYTKNLDETDSLAQSRKLNDYLRDGSLPLDDVMAQILKLDPDVPNTLLLIDQFEELYTLTPDVETREKFIDTILPNSNGVRGGRGGSETHPIGIKLRKVRR